MRTRPPSLKRVVIATANRDKLRELRRLLRGSGLSVIGLRPEQLEKLPPERGSTYRANARAKARAAAADTGLPALGDDSGLEVYALGGRPGLLSSRWRPTTRARNSALLRALARRSDASRRARFVCAICLALPAGRSWTRQASCAGRIALAQRGRGGFGYDPVFIVDGGGGRTMAELGAAHKDRLGHRGRALRKLWPRLLSLP